jgi:hypothetical protein
MCSLNAFGQSSKNKFYFEPFFKIDYQIWQNEQLESKDDGNYTYKFRGLYYGPRVGLKVIKTYNSFVIYGAEASYSYLFNTYAPDEGTSSEAQTDDSFETDSTASQYQLGLFTGIQYKRFGLKFQYIPISAIENEAKYSTFSSTETTNTYQGTGIGVGLSYIYKPKVNLYFEYQTFTLNTFTIDGAEYQLPTSTGSMTFQEFTTTKYSFGVSLIF